MRSFVLTTAILLTLAARAQTPTPPMEGPTTTLTVDVRIVSLEAIVRDKKGNIIQGLTKDDFELRLDGKPWPIRYFAADNTLPLTLGLMVDTSGSMTLHTQDEQLAAADFLESMLGRQQDRAFLVRFDSNVEMLQGPTADVWKLKSALWMLGNPGANPVDFHARRPVATTTTPVPAPAAAPAKPPVTPAPVPVARRHGGTLLFDGIAAAAQKVIGKEPGRRALIVLTDGDDNGSRSSLDDAIRAAQNADVAIYSALFLNDHDYAGLGRYPDHGAPRLSGREVMERLAQQTGGRCFVLDKKMSMDHVFTLIEQDMHSQYRLGFTPPALVQPAPAAPPTPPSRSSRSRKKSPPPPPAPTQTTAIPAPKPPTFHTLELKTHDGHLIVQARTGYFAPQ
jgi:VWFA-related protein